jgi:hypothetical protein
LWKYWQNQIILPEREIWQRNIPPELLIVLLIDLFHAPLADLGCDFLMGADHEEASRQTTVQYNESVWKLLPV